MIDIKKELVAAIKTATSWDVYYALTYKPGTFPAVTYKEIDNAVLYKGDTINYDTLRYEITLWSQSMEDIVAKSAAIDTALEALGWTRYSASELNYENYIIKVIRYVATGYNEV